MASSSLSIEQQLKLWKSSLPNSIALITGADIQSQECGSLSTKLRLVLTLRYHNTRILAHRSMLDRHLKLLSEHTVDAEEAAAVAQFGSWSKTICLQSAEAIVDIVHSALRFPDRQHEFLGAWWFTLYYGSWHISSYNSGSKTYRLIFSFQCGFGCCSDARIQWLPELAARTIQRRLNKRNATSRQSGIVPTPN